MASSRASSRPQSLPYVGAPVLGSALGMDKEKAKIIWKAARHPRPSLDLRRESPDLEPGRLEALVARGWGAELGWPAFVKPVSAGSSVGAAKAADPESLPDSCLGCRPGMGRAGPRSRPSAPPGR